MFVWYCQGVLGEKRLRTTALEYKGELLPVGAEQ